jgi:hypothetical protein
MAVWSAGRTLSSAANFFDAGVGENWLIIAPTLAFADARAEAGFAGFCLR